MSAGLTDAERAMLLDGQEHTVEAACWSASCAGSLPWVVARIKADAIATARAEERALCEQDRGAMEERIEFLLNAQREAVQRFADLQYATRHKAADA